MRFSEDVLLIAGPTAGGKTSLSIEAAKENDAVIVNADSMQVYEDLRIVSARPSETETSQVPHFLFGHVDGARAYSVAQWLDDVSRLISEQTASGRKLIFVGGTGLYFTSLLEGLSPVPEIKPEVREKWRAASKTAEARSLHETLMKVDLRVAKTLQPNDVNRIVRALEVYESTGKSLAAWQEDKGVPVLGNDRTCRKLLVLPDRKLLHSRINQRFDLMIDEGAVEEVESLLTRKLDPTLPVMKAIGVPHLGDYLDGKYPLDEAVERAKAATRQYAKRQSTWFRNTFDDSWEHFGG